MAAAAQSLSRKLYQSERRIRNIVNTVPGILYIALADGASYQCVYVSPQIEVELGFSVREWLDDPDLWVRQLYDEDRAPLLRKIVALAAGSDQFEYEYRIWTKGRHSLRWYHDKVRVERDQRGKAIELVGLMTDVTERKERDKQQERHREQIRDVQAQTIRALGRMASKRDPYTYGHQERVSELSLAIGAEMGLNARQLEGLKFGAQIHDIGKVYIPSEILNRPGRLTGPEFELIKTHAQAGFDMVSDIEFPWPIREIILQHHERIDGSGYPNGLKGEDICLEARILAIGDTIDAMTSHRPYRPALGVGPAIEAIRTGRGRLFDCAAADACLTLHAEGRLPVAGAAG